MFGGNASTIEIKIEALKAFNHSFDLKNRLKTQMPFNVDSLLTIEDVETWLAKSKKGEPCFLLQYLRQIRKILGVEKSAGVFGFISTNALEQDLAGCESLVTSIPPLSEETLKKGLPPDVVSGLRQNYQDISNYLHNGVNMKKILKNISDLSWVNNVKKLSEGKNGITFKLEFSKYGIKTNAVLKVTKVATTDNLFYEFKVGQYLNEKALLYPCFIHTYNILLLPEKPLQNITKNDVNIMKTLSPEESTIAYTCEKSKSLALMIEYIDSMNTLGHYIDVAEGKIRRVIFDDIVGDIYGMLFQVYFPLYYLQEEFTHNDLHSNNILYYTPFPGSNRYVQLIYHMADGTTISFKSKYIMKIIDYGRSFVKTLSVETIDAVCSEKECGDDCGKDKGYLNVRGKYKTDFYNSLESLEFLIRVKKISLKTASESLKIKEQKKNELFGILKNKVQEKNDSLGKLTNKEYENLENEVDELENEYDKLKNEVDKLKNEVDKLKNEIFNIINYHDISKKNVSIDLWSLDEVYRFVILKKKMTKYCNNVIENYGVEHPESKYVDENSEVNNVTDAIKMLINAIKGETNNINSKYEKWKLGATINVYSNGQPYTYVVNNE